MKKKLIVFLLAVHFFKELVWLALIPLWHFPDEEQHFAQVAFYGEKGYFPEQKEGVKLDVSREIDVSSEILGTKRDVRGHNKFTYHPEYRLPYSKGETGIFEEEIKVLNVQEDRQEMVKREAARYGPVYYFLSALPYRVFYQTDLFTRVFTSRFISVLLSTLTVFLVYLIGGQVFKREFLKMALSFLVSFQPMFSFVSAGVNSDNLFNLVFTLILYGCLRIFLMKNSSLPKDRGRVFDFFLLATGLIIGFYTKKQIFIALPIVAFAFLLSQLRKGKKARKKGLAVLGIIVFLFFLFSWGRLKIPDYDPSRPSRLAESFGQYIFWHLKHTVAETIPWYWGVFNWLGVTLPGWVNRLQARLLILALIGILIYFWHQIKKKKILSLKNLRIIFLFGSAFIYYAAIIIWDYFFRQSHSFSFGMQGRYFFPTIASHLLFLIWGLLSLIPEKIKRFRQGLIKVLIGWWFIFQLIGLQTAARAYYQLWPLATFLNQVSQYKPLFLKGFTLLGLFLVFFISSLVFLAVYFINFPRSSRGFRAWLGRK